ncbi:MAG: cation:proton antiporter [Planctomycetes bacterium]|nr:cation:proton antiporter [Planctomycetota bacterium]
MHELIQDITFSIVAAWLLGLLAHHFRQPVLLAYLVGGFVLGPSCSRMVQSTENIHSISELGLIFLLFMIGLEIDLKKIISAGSSITITALVQILGGAALGVGFFWACGFGLGGGNWDALYLAIAAALSSTVIIVKLLYEKQELDTLTGRITLGVLVLQDLAAIVFLAMQPNLENLAPGILLMSLARVVLLVTITLAISKFVLPAVFHRIARSPELVQVGALAWCFLVGELGARLDLSREMGALIAGVALSTFPYALDVTAKVTTLRDFFVTLFFVGLGMQIPVPSFALALWTVVFCVFLVVSRFLTTFTPLFLMKQGLRTSLITSINLSQVGEFSLVVLALGTQAGHLKDPTTAGMVGLAFALLAGISSFGMSHSDNIVRRMIPWLKARGFRDLDFTHDDTHAPGGHPEGKSRIIFLGFFRTASSLLEEMQRHAPDLIGDTTVVDFSPVARAGLLERKIRVIYGDISQRETLLHAGVDRAEVLICTVPDSFLKGITNERLVKVLRELNPEAKIISTADVLSKVDTLLQAGADYVSIARLREASDLLEVVRAATDGLLDEKREQLKTILGDRREVLG